MRSPSTSTSSFSGSSASLSNHSSISPASIRRASPNDSTNNRATVSASSLRRGLTWNELIERLRQREEIRELSRRLDGRALAEPVDPDAAQTQLVRRRDVVEEGCADVHVALPRRLRAEEELVPVLVRRLVGADLLRDDDLVERHADLHLRGRDEIVVGVREDRELPAAPAQLLERALHFGEGTPPRQRLREPVLLPCGSAETAHRFGQHVAVAHRPVALQLRLDLVVAREQLIRAVVVEDARQLGSDAAVPVDQRAVTVECRPALHERPCYAAICTGGR